MKARTLAGKIARRVPWLRQLLLERDHLRQAYQQSVLGWPPGHFYSPIPSIEEIRAQERQIFDHVPDGVPGVDLNAEGQLRLLDALTPYYRELPFAAHHREGLRYFFENPYYSYGEAILLYCVIRHARPKRVIEIGSGYSSCAILDTNELFFDNAISCTFIDPDPARLLSLIAQEDAERVTVLRQRVQDVELGLFQGLGAGDILFVDSSHVSKVHSDVNHILFEILPRLDHGVLIHFHDIGYPFEYPKEWIYEGRYWNEAYLLRAFLQYNSAFEILVFNAYLARRCEAFLAQRMPLLLKNPGSSLWIKKAGSSIEGRDIPSTGL